MLESLTSCHASNYSHIVHLLEGATSVTPQLNYITDIVLELKAELDKINTKIKESKNQLSIIHLSLINEIGDNKKSNLSISAPFQHKYHFKHPKNKNPFPLHDIKIQKEVGEKLVVKSSEKAEKEDKDRV